MESLARLVSESLARYGLDRPVDYRRLQWSRWFRCESLHSLLHIPSKPGVFALAEEVMSSTSADGDEDEEGRRMLSVLQFREDEDMAFVLDRMISRPTAQLSSGRCFVRFVVIEDDVQRRSICNALNQWLVSTAETVTGIGAHFATSPEFKIGSVGNKSAGRTLPPPGLGQSLCATSDTSKHLEQTQASEAKRLSRQDLPGAQAATLDSGFASNIHCPHPLPSGF
jgi:hypothetical protein